MKGNEDIGTEEREVNVIDLIFFDIDGTLREFESGRIPPATKEAVRKAKEAGVLTAIATGRHLLEIEEEQLLEDMEFDFYITLNGQYCSRGKEIVFANPIPADQVKKMIEMIEEEPFPCIFMEADAMYINLVDETVQRVQQEIKTSVPPIRPLKTALERPIYQMIPFLPVARAAELEDRLENCQAVHWSDGIAFDVTSGGISKATGMQKVLDVCGLTRESCAAIGDGYNDLEMIQFAGLGIAMGNAKTELKAAADRVTAAIDQDGLAMAVEQILRERV